MKKKNLIKKQQLEIDSLRKKYSDVLNDLDIVINKHSSIDYYLVIMRWNVFYGLEKHLYKGQSKQSPTTGLINTIENENT